jgi:probable rRNA maturation factor
MRLLIRNSQKRPFNEAVLKRAALKALRAERCPEKAEISLFFCGDRRIRTLNHIWRKKDAATDVLSFPLLNHTAGGRVWHSHPGAPVILGDVIISVQTAARQAKRAGIPLQQELNFLLVHGILHLLGWNDSSPEERNRMLRRQQEILGRT